jgi:hypothetical protein
MTYGETFHVNIRHVKVSFNMDLVCSNSTACDVQGTFQQLSAEWLEIMSIHDSKQAAEYTPVTIRHNFPTLVRILRFRYAC